MIVLWILWIVLWALHGFPWSWDHWTIWSGSLLLLVVIDLWGSRE